MSSNRRVDIRRSSSLGAPLERQELLRCNKQWRRFDAVPPVGRQLSAWPFACLRASRVARFAQTVSPITVIGSKRSQIEALFYRRRRILLYCAPSGHRGRARIGREKTYGLTVGTSHCRRDQCICQPPYGDWALGLRPGRPFRGASRRRELGRSLHVLSFGALVLAKRTERATIDKEP